MDKDLKSILYGFAFIYTYMLGGVALILLGAGAIFSYIEQSTLSPEYYRGLNVALITFSLGIIPSILKYYKV